MKTNKLLFPGIFILFLGVLNSCIIGPSIKGNGNVVEKERQVGEFDKIKVSAGMNVWIRQGEPTRVVVVADENLHDAIITETEGNTLKIFVDSNIRRANEKKVLVTVKNLEGIISSSGSNVFSNGVLNFEKLDISTSSGSNATLEVISHDLKITSSSGSNAIFKGKAYKAKLDASSGSNLKARDLEVASCYAEASSGANVQVCVTNEFDGHASSGGNVLYYGNPEKRNINTSSGGNIINKQ